MKMSAEADPRPLGFGKSSAVRLTRSETFAHPPAMQSRACHESGLCRRGFDAASEVQQGEALAQISEVLPYILPQGLAFSDSERDRLYLRGLLPPVTLSQEVQLERTLLNIRSKATNLEKLMYMQGLQGVGQLAAGSAGTAGTGRPAGSAGSSGCGGPAESVVLSVKTPQVVAQLATGSVGQRRVVAQQAEQRCLSGQRSATRPAAAHAACGPPCPAVVCQERNERLFYRVLCESFDELMPVMSMPVVRDSCRKYGLMFKSVPRALFITLEDRGRVFRILKNWPERNVQLVGSKGDWGVGLEGRPGGRERVLRPLFCMQVVVTDGERTGSAGDLGVQAVGVPISKLAMYTACGGINPAVCLPVVIDTGTDNEELLESPFYVGSRHRRIRGDPYYELLDEFLVAIKRRYGNTTLLQFEDMTFDNATKLLNMYRTEFPCFNDAMSASAASVLACMMAAMPRMGGKLADQTFMFSGDSGNVTCMAELLATAIAQQTNQTVLEARRKIWLVDAHGLVTRERGDSCSLEGYKLPFCHSGPTAVDLAAAVDLIKPTVLVGFDCSPTGAHFKFDQRASGCAMALHGLSAAVCTAMASHTARPLLLALTSEDPEVQPADAYAWTQGRALLACGDSGGGQVTLAEGHTLEPSQCTPHYIFPGVGLGVMISKCTKLRDEQFIAAAEAVTRMVGEDEARRGALLPPLKNIREVAVSVARAVAQKAYEGGYATALPKPHNLAERARQFMYSPLYRRYR
ncbi:hypothetical protein QJQ45_019748 [Haematococcus lacustris]|nr:hypothetical protein QJQ45_019748 [Haematococcus lacustris]